MSMRSNHVTHMKGTSSIVPLVPLPKVAAGDRLRAAVVSLRPRQWTKNLVVFIGLIFAHKLFDAPSLGRAAFAFLIFCLVSSAIYLLNDLLDVENDRQHPVKCMRPIASGRLPASWAIVMMGILFLISSSFIALFFFLPLFPSPKYGILSGMQGTASLLALIVATYVFSMVLYSIRLKRIVLVDVFLIAFGFVLRIVAGTVIISVHLSSWLYLVACFLSLFLALCKRRQELSLLQGQAKHFRQILKDYTVPLLDQMIGIVCAATIIAYSLYTIQGTNETHDLSITIPFVLYGMFRYLYLVAVKMEGGSPEEVLLRDYHILGSTACCFVLILLLLYFIP